MDKITKTGVGALSVGLVVAGFVVLRADRHRREDVAQTAEIRDEEATPQRNDQRASTDTSRLTSAITTLTDSVVVLQERIARLERAKEDTPAEDAPRADDPREREALEIAAREEANERLDVIEDSFRSEVRDAAWAKQAEDQLREAFATGHFPGTRALATDCKATFCRMSVEHDSVEGSAQFELIKRQIPGSYYFQHMEPDEKGHGQTVAFFLRRGAERGNVIAQLMGHGGAAR